LKRGRGRPLRRRPLRLGLREDGKANHEFMWFRSCLTRYCTYAGVSVPNATRQAKDWVFEDTTFGGPGQYGVAWNGGSCKFYRCNFDALDCAAAWFGGSNEAVTFLDCTGESNKRFGQFTGCVNVNLLGCRLNLIAAASPQPRGQEFLAGGSNWTIAGCVFEEADGLNGFLRPGDGASVVVQATQFHSARPFPTDDATRFRLVTHGVRVAQGNDLLPEGGSYFARNVPGVTNAGGGLLLSDGRWPPRGSYAGGTYTPGPGRRGSTSTPAGCGWRCRAGPRRRSGWRRRRVSETLVLLAAVLFLPWLTDWCRRCVPA
jgi:hypothetical protein